MDIDALKLLTPKDVAKLLQISEKTVYKHQRRLCDFHPVGIKCLRFRAKDIYDIMKHSTWVAASGPVEWVITRRGRRTKTKAPNCYGF